METHRHNIQSPNYNNFHILVVFYLDRWPKNDIVDVFDKNDSSFDCHHLSLLIKYLKYDNIISNKPLDMTDIESLLYCCQFFSGGKDKTYQLIKSKLSKLPYLSLLFLDSGITN